MGKTSDTVRAALLVYFDEQHQRRVGYPASRAWLNNSIKHIEQQRMWRRLFEIMDDTASPPLLFNPSPATGEENERTDP